MSEVVSFGTIAYSEDEGRPNYYVFDGKLWSQWSPHYQLPRRTSEQVFAEPMFQVIRNGVRP